MSISSTLSSVGDEPLKKKLSNKKLKMIESPRSSKRNLTEDKESTNFLDIIREPEFRISNGDSPVSHRRSGTFTEPSSRLRSGVRNSLNDRIKSDIYIPNDAKYIMPDATSPKCNTVPSPCSKQVFDYPSENDRLLQMDITFKECNPLNIHSCKFQYTPNDGRKGGDDTELGIWEQQTNHNATNSTYDDQITTT